MFMSVVLNNSNLLLLKCQLGTKESCFMTACVRACVGGCAWVCVCVCAELSALWSDSRVDLQHNLQRHVCCWQLLYTHSALSGTDSTKHTRTNTHTRSVSACSLTVSLWSPCIIVERCWWGTLGSWRNREREVIQSGGVLVVAHDNAGCKQCLAWVEKKKIGLISCCCLLCKLLSLSRGIFKLTKQQLPECNVGVISLWLPCVFILFD